MTAEKLQEILKNMQVNAERFEADAEKIVNEFKKAQQKFIRQLEEAKINELTSKTQNF